MATKFFCRLAPLLCASWWLGLSGCEHTIAPTANATVQPTLASIQSQVFNVSCALPSCHSSASQRGGLILEQGKSYGNLVNVLATNTAARAKKMRRVVPSQPDSSFLLAKLIGPESREGSLMPEGAGRLSPQAIEAIREWIRLGAQRNPDSLSGKLATKREPQQKKAQK